MIKDIGGTDLTLATIAAKQHKPQVELGLSEWKWAVEENLLVR